MISDSDESEGVSLIVPSSEKLKRAEKENKKKRADSSRDESSDSSDERSKGKKSNSKSPSKIRRSGELMSIEETEKEYKFRRKHFHDESEVVTNRKLRCTSCNNSLQSVVLDGRAVYEHPVLKVLMCERCVSFYGDGHISIDEDGSDKYCRWCGQGGTLYCCADCCCAFCKKCIKGNLNRSVLLDIESEDWKCFVCDGKPLWELRAICANAMKYAKKIRRSKRGENKRNLKMLKKKRASIQPRSQRLNKHTTSDSSSSDTDSVSKQPVSSKNKRKRSNSSPVDSDGGKKDKKKKVENNDSDSDVIEMKKVPKETIIVTLSDSEEDNEENKKNNENEDNEESSDVSHKPSSRKNASNKQHSKKKQKNESEDNEESSDVSHKPSSRKNASHKECSKKKQKNESEDNEESSDVSHKPSCRKNTSHKQRSKKKQKNESEDNEESSDVSHKPSFRKDTSHKQCSKKKQKNETDDSEEQNESDGNEKSSRKDSKSTKSKSPRKGSSSGNEDNTIVNTEDGDVLHKKLPEKVNSSSAKSACDWLTDHLNELSKLGELLTYQARRILEKKVHEEAFTNPENVRKVVHNLKVLMNLTEGNMEHSKGFLSLHHKYWMKRVIRKHRSKKNADGEEIKSKNDKEQSDKCCGRKSVVENDVCDGDTVMDVSLENKSDDDGMQNGTKEKKVTETDESKNDKEQSDECGGRKSVVENEVCDGDTVMNVSLENKSDDDGMQNGSKEKKSTETGVREQNSDKEEDKKAESKSPVLNGVLSDPMDNDSNCLDDDNNSRLECKDTETSDCKSGKHDSEEIEKGETQAKDSKKRKSRKDNDNEERDIASSNSENEEGVKKVVHNKKKMKVDDTVDNEKRDLVSPEIFVDSDIENAVTDNNQTNGDIESNTVAPENSDQSEDKKISEDQEKLSENEDKNEKNIDKCKKLKSKKGKKTVTEDDSSVKDISDEDNKSPVSQSFESMTTLLMDEITDGPELSAVDPLQIPEGVNTDQSEVKKSEEVLDKSEITDIHSDKAKDTSENKNEERKEESDSDSDNATIECLFDMSTEDNINDTVACTETQKESDKKDVCDVTCPNEEQLEKSKKNGESGSNENTEDDSLEQNDSEDLLLKCNENNSGLENQSVTEEKNNIDGTTKAFESTSSKKEHNISDDGDTDSDIGKLQISDDDTSSNGMNGNGDSKAPVSEHKDSDVEDGVPVSDKSGKTPFCEDNVGDKDAVPISVDKKKSDKKECDKDVESEKPDNDEDEVPLSDHNEKSESGKCDTNYTEEGLKAQETLLGYTSDDEEEEDGGSQTETPKKKKERSKKVKKNENSDDKDQKGEKEECKKKRRPGPKSRTRVGIESTNSELSSSEDSESSSGKQCTKEDGSKKKKKKKRFRLKDTEAYKQDKKLGWKCSVVIGRLAEHVFQKHYERYYSEEDDESEKAAKDDKEIQSLVNLKSLKKGRGKKSDGGTDSEGSDESESAKKNKKKIKTKKDKKKEEEQKLIDFFKKSDDDDDDDDILSSDASGSEKEVASAMKLKKKNFIDKKNEMAMKMLLGSSSEDDSDGASENEDEAGKKKKEKKGKVKKEDDETKKDEDQEEKEKEDKEKKEDKKRKKGDSDENSIDNSSDDSKKKKKRDWRRDKLLTERFTDMDTSDEERLYNAKKNRELKEDSMKKKARRRIFGSDDDNSVGTASSSDNSSSDDIFVTKKKKKKQQQPKKSNSDKSSSDSDIVSVKKVKRRRIKAPASDSSSNDDPVDASQKSETPGKGRKNIHRIMKDENVGEATRRAAREEEERKKRILEKQKMYNEIYKAVEGVEKIDKLVLDFDAETKEELVSVDPFIVSKLKPHQVKGVKFMWDASFESLKRIEKTKGSGCILAHCMGLGKTFQVVALVHTLLNHKETKVKTVLVVCPLSTVLNWVNEFNMWLKDIGDGDQVNVFELSKYKQNYERMYRLKDWQEEGGVMVIGYDMYRNLTNTQTKRLRKKAVETFQSTLVDPGPDLVVCDEGHLLKNEDTALAKAMRRIRTLRRIVLTGTPLQNNLKEYHCMVQFVKPNLLGTRKEFLNRFVNPITNGQFEDSTSHDVKIMKRRAHVLHKMLEGSVQRFDYAVLTPFLPPKYEYVISIPLSEVQIKAYRHYLDNMSMGRSGEKSKGTALFADFQNLQRIWTHPRVLMMNTEKAEKTAERKRLMESDSEGSLRDFIADDSSENTSSSSSSSDDDDSEKSDSDVQVVKDSKEEKKAKKYTRATRSKGLEDPEIMEVDKDEQSDKPNPLEWWKQFIQGDELESINYSGKLVLLFYILRECEKIGDKVLVFSQSLYSLDLIEYFLSCIDTATQNGETKESLGNNTGSWAMGLDYFRLDGSTSSENRSLWCKAFNREENSRARLFIISTRAGGLGINLFAANRVIIFDASWNPSHDVQSIFRVYRFGQKKPCYIYRFLAQGTMEEKIYDRQVTKLSLSCRVVDEQQIERHYNMADLQELYQFDPEQKAKRPTPILPKDRLLAEMLKEHEQWIVTYHEHDSLLENKEEEELNEEERQAAWEEYENEKKGKVIAPAVGGIPAALNMPALREALRKENPLATEEQLEQKLNMVIAQIYEYMNSQQNGVATQNYPYTNAQIQALQQYRIQQEQLARVQQEKFRQQQEAMRAAINNYPNMQNMQILQNLQNPSFQQYLQDQKTNPGSYPLNVYRGPMDKNTNVLRMHSKIVPFNTGAASTSKVMMKPYGTDSAELISRYPVMLPATIPSNAAPTITENSRPKSVENKKKPVPDEVIETID